MCLCYEFDLNDFFPLAFNNYDQPIYYIFLFIVIIFFSTRKTKLSIYVIYSRHIYTNICLARGGVDTLCCFSMDAIRTLNQILRFIMI